MFYDKQLTAEIIGAAIEVHKTLGPGLLESTYQTCLARELSARNIPFEREKPLQVTYKGELMECGYRIDFLIRDRVVVELKSVDKLLPIHEAQLMTYVKLAGCKIGLLINFNVLKLVDGVVRRVL